MSMMGVLGAGLTTALGVATGNDYLVGAGANAGGYYATQYDKLSTSLIEEQRAERLAAAADLRQKNLLTFQEQLTRPRWDAEQERLAADSKRADDLAASQMEVNKSSVALHGESLKLAQAQAYNSGLVAKASLASEEARLDAIKKQSDPEWLKKMANVAYEVEKIQGDRAAADSTAEAENLYGKGSPEAELAKKFIFYKRLGINPTDLSKGTAINQEALGRVMTEAGTAAAAQYDKELASESPDIRLAAQKKVSKARLIAADEFVTTVQAVSGSTVGGALLGPEGAAAPPPRAANQTEQAMVNKVLKGDATVDQFVAEAKTKEQIEAAERVAGLIAEAQNTRTAATVKNPQDRSIPSIIPTPARDDRSQAALQPAVEAANYSPDMLSITDQKLYNRIENPKERKAWMIAKIQSYNNAMRSINTQPSTRR